MCYSLLNLFFFFMGPATPEVYTDGHTLSLPTALPIAFCAARRARPPEAADPPRPAGGAQRRRTADGGLPGAGERRPAARRRRPLGSARLYHAAMGDAGGHRSARRAADRLQAARPRELGRAACRERGFQYV